MARQQSGETEYQGQFLSWIKEDLRDRRFGFEDATQEFPNSAGKRSDVIVWLSRAANQGFLEIELKTPRTPLSDVTFQEDAIRKARIVGAPFLALSNMRETVIYTTPPEPRQALLASDVAKAFPNLPEVRSVSDWIDPGISRKLHATASALLLAAHDLQTKGSLDGIVVDATVFVDALKGPVRRLSAVLKGDLQVALTSRATSKTLNDWAKEQGLVFFVSDLAAALAGQLAYRITGQILFYYAFRRHQASLSSIDLDSGTPVSGQLRAYWDQVRAFDYEALFEPSPLESVALSPSSDRIVRELVERLSQYDWNDIDVDVLGSIFEQLLPASERIVLGQYYTPPLLADLVISLTLDDNPSAVFDPAVGSGTFLFRTYDRLQRKHGWDHEKALDVLWGADISAFAAELAVINLCRQDLRSYANYPRIMVRDFFTLAPSDVVRVPVAKPLPGGSPLTEVDMPSFKYILGNPPFVRSQQLDDLDAKYKVVLHDLAARNRIDDAKFDAFAYFIVHASDFLPPGGRLGFVTSASWLTTEFGVRLQRFILSAFKIRAVVFSHVEPFFPYQDINTVAVVVERREHDTGPSAGEVVRFVTLTKPLPELLPAPTKDGYWNDVDLLVDEMLDAGPGSYEGFKVSTRDADGEYQAILQMPTVVRNWERAFRESDIYRDLFGV